MNETHCENHNEEGPLSLVALVSAFIEMHFGKIKNAIYFNLFACAQRLIKRSNDWSCIIRFLEESVWFWFSEDLAYQPNWFKKNKNIDISLYNEKVEIPKPIDLKN